MRTPAEAVAAFESLVAAAQAAEVPAQITLTARPVVDAEYPAETIPVVKTELPEGTVPATPDALAVEIRVANDLGAPLPPEFTQAAADLGLQIGTSDTLLI